MWFVENKHSTARLTFARVRVNAHTDARTRFVIADRPQTIVWAFTLSSRTSIWLLMATRPPAECLISMTPEQCPPDPRYRKAADAGVDQAAVNLASFYMVGRGGRALQLDPIKPMLKAPATKRLKLEYDKLASSFTFNCNLRRYTASHAASSGP